MDKLAEALGGYHQLPGSCPEGDEPGGSSGGAGDGWRGVGYVRIDGSHDSHERLAAVSRFRSCPSVRVALLSITAAAVGELMCWPIWGMVPQPLLRSVSRLVSRLLLLLPATAPALPHRASLPHPGRATSTVTVQASSFVEFVELLYHPFPPPPTRTGLDFSTATHVVFVELPNEVALVRQAEDRAHRKGQDNAVNVYFLCARGTSDDSRWQKLNSSLDNITQVGGEGVKSAAGVVGGALQPVHSLAPAQ